MTPDIEIYPDHIRTREERFSYICEKYATWFQFLAAKHLFARLSRESEDVVQDALLEAWRGLHSYREEGSLRAWISTIVIRVSWARNSKNDPLMQCFVGEGCDGPTTLPNCEEALQSSNILSRIVPSLSQTQQEFLAQWRRGDFDGIMQSNDNSGRLLRLKRRMRSIATRKKIIPQTRDASRSSAA